MKTLLIIGILLVGISAQAFSMGHPHNIFAARKQLRTKASASVAKRKSTSSLCLQQSVQLAKTALSDHFVAVFSHLRSARTH